MYLQNKIFELPFKTQLIIKSSTNDCSANVCQDSNTEYTEFKNQFLTSLQYNLQ